MTLDTKTFTHSLNLGYLAKLLVIIPAPNLPASPYLYVILVSPHTFPQQANTNCAPLVSSASAADSLCLLTASCQLPIATSRAKRGGTMGKRNPGKLTPFY